MENIMFQASPGVGADYDDSMVLDAKGYGASDDDFDAAFMLSDDDERLFADYLWE